jgi:hypothetical protein
VAPPINADPSQPPPSGLADVDVTVRRQQPGDTREGTLERAVTYYWPPEIDLVTPAQGPTAGGTAVLLSGRFFRVPEGGAIFVRFDGEDCGELVLHSSTALSCVTPPGDPALPMWRWRTTPSPLALRRRRTSTWRRPGWTPWIPPRDPPSAARPWW